MGGIVQGDGTPVGNADFIVGRVDRVLKLKDIDPALLSEIDKDVHRLEMIARRFSKIGSATDLRQADLREVVRRSLGYMESGFPIKCGSIWISRTWGDGYRERAAFDWVIENLLKMRWMPWAARERFCSIFPKGGERCFWIFPILEKVSRNHSSKPFLSRIHHQGAWLGTWPVACEADCGGIPQRKDFVKESELGKGTTFRMVLK